MQIALHKNASTTPAVRAEIAVSPRAPPYWPSVLASPRKRSTSGKDRQRFNDCLHRQQRKTPPAPHIPACITHQPHMEKLFR